MDAERSEVHLPSLRLQRTALRAAAEPPERSAAKRGAVEVHR